MGGLKVGRRFGLLLLLVVIGLFISPTVHAGVLSGGTTTSPNLRSLNYLSYTWYHMYLKKFNETYQKAVELGVDNETLQKAMELHKMAKENYNKALELSNGCILAHLEDLRLLSLLRNSYINELKAVRILEDAIETILNRS